MPIIPYFIAQSPSRLDCEKEPSVPKNYLVNPNFEKMRVLQLT